MRFLSNIELEERARALLKSWGDAEDAGALMFPIDVERLATDFLGIQVKFGSLDSGVIAEFRVPTETFVLDREHNRNRFRARFSIAHEIGHLELHSALGSAIFCRDSASNRHEIQANRFAGALLMPAADLVEAVAQYTGELGKFSRRVADADIVSACRWLRSLLHQAPLQERSLRDLARKFGVSMQSLQVRLVQLGLVSR